MDKHWVKDKYTEFYHCPWCGSMVSDNGYGGCDYIFCPYCGRDAVPVQPKKEEPANESD